MWGMFLIMEAIHSCAIEHPDGCPCVVCRAAGGDRDALAEIVAACTNGPRAAGSED